MPKPLAFFRSGNIASIFPAGGHLRLQRRYMVADDSMSIPAVPVAYTLALSGLISYSLALM